MPDYLEAATQFHWSTPEKDRVRAGSNLGPRYIVLGRDEQRLSRIRPQVEAGAPPGGGAVVAVAAVAVLAVLGAFFIWRSKTSKR